VRSTVGTATDANAMLRILFSRLGKPHVGSPQAFSFNIPSVKGAGAVVIQRGAGKPCKESRSFELTGGHVPSLRGHRERHRYRPDRAVRRGQVAVGGGDQGPGLHRRWLGDAHLRGRRLDPNKKIADYTDAELDRFLRQEATKVKVEGINLTYEGLVPKVQKTMLSKDREAMQPHIRAFADRAVTFMPCPDCGGTRLNEGRARRGSATSTSPTPCAMQISDLAAWVRGLDEPSVAPLLTNLRELLDSFVEIGLGYLSLDRSAGRCPAVRRSAPKMIRHLGSSLTDVTYVFDEPTIGLHPHDIQRMNDLLIQLRDKGNTVLVVEHKPEAIEIADHVVDLGPGAGSGGGEVVFEGTVEELRASGTLTGRHLDDRASLKSSDPNGERSPRDPRSQHEQPCRASMSTSRSGYCRRHRRRRIGQELADPRVRIRS
jgi:excinuclease UvrABC ATPase subunit